MPPLLEATDIDAHDSTRTSRDPRANCRMFSFEVRDLSDRPSPLDLDLCDTAPNEEWSELIGMMARVRSIEESKCGRVR
jgi:hypothetical protein